MKRQVRRALRLNEKEKGKKGEEEKTEEERKGETIF